MLKLQQIKQLQIINMKIGIYCRVSSKSQEDNYSLDYQYDNGKKYCIDNGYEYELFSESESGVNKDRKRNV